MTREQLFFGWLLFSRLHFFKFSLFTVSHSRRTSQSKLLTFIHVIFVVKHSLNSVTKSLTAKPSNIGKWIPTMKTNSFSFFPYLSSWIKFNYCSKDVGTFMVPTSHINTNAGLVFFSLLYISFVKFKLNSCHTVYIEAAAKMWKRHSITQVKFCRDERREGNKKIMQNHN